jgi:two-component system NtrC family sensor kinase
MTAWMRDTSLGARLSFFVAVIVVGVVAGVSYWELRSYTAHIDHDLMDAASLGAESAADDLAERALPLDPQDVRDTLHDLIQADPVLDAMSVLEIDSTGRLRVFTSTSTEERADVLDLAARAIQTGAPAVSRTSTVIMLARPVPRRGALAVAVTVGLESLLQTRAHAMRVALGFAIPTILIVTALVHVTVRRFIGQPLDAMLRTMQYTRSGGRGARTRLTQRDELGTIARGLDEMLDQIERFQESLHERVEEATRSLSLRNAQLAASQTELFTLRESLGRAERVAALGQVAANVVHQAGTPLNLVSGYIQMIRDDPRTDDRTRTRLRIVDEQIQQVTHVLRTMLDHARQPSEPQVVSLASVVGRVSELAQPRLARHHIRLEASAADNLPRIRADATQLEMALLNLVANALDAMPSGGILTMHAVAASDRIRIEVADTGSGIPAGILDRLFEPWVTTKPAGHGSGLGLAIVRDVVRAHGGSIAALNRPTGASFVIDLPVGVAERSVE